MTEQERWIADGWKHDPELLIQIMSEYAEKNDGSGCLDLEMIDDILAIAESKKLFIKSKATKP